MQKSKEQIQKEKEDYGKNIQSVLAMMNNYQPKTSETVMWDNRIMLKWHYDFLIKNKIITPRGVADIAGYGMFMEAEKRIAERLYKQKYAQKLNTPPLAVYNK